jgi:23S rRNA (guanosine2251-2'-O)-methyltransferase
VGNEGKGIRRLVKEKCDFLVKIPLHGKIESLNASVAGALVMFEAAKVRKSP